MRVLVFTTLFPNSRQLNNAIFVKHRMKAVAASGSADVRVIAPVPYYPPLPFGGERMVYSEIPYFEEIDGLKVWHPRYLVTPKVGMTFYGISMFLGVLALARRIYREWPFDMIDAHYVYPDGFAALMLSKVFKCRLVVSARGTDINLYPQFRLIRPMIKSVLRGSDHLIAVCRSLAEIMISHGAAASKVSVIPNGISLAQFQYREPLASRTKLGLPAQGRILLFIGSLTERKGVHLLLQALKLLKSSNRLNFTTCIVGKGPLRGALEREIVTGGLETDVRLVGEIDNQAIADWYFAADLFFLGSSREGWPNVVSEALACGMPVVATRVNGIPEIVDSDTYGYIVDRDPEVFAVYLERGMNRAWDREAIRHHGRSRTWNTVAEEVGEVFCRVLCTNKS